MMQEFNLLSHYPPSPVPRYVGPQIRTIHNKIRAANRDEKYYDGDRRDGYGGYRYDGRWKPIVDLAVQRYGLTPEASILQVGCEKGFFLNDFKERFPAMRLSGYEMSPYAVAQSLPSVRSLIKQGHYRTLPYADHSFDWVVAIGVIYTLTLADAISCLKEIERVGRGKSFITLGAFRNVEEERLFRYWSVLGSTILHVDDWREVLRAAGYTGDYTFMTARELNLVWTEKKWEEVVL